MFDFDYSIRFMNLIDWIRSNTYQNLFMYVCNVNVEFIKNKNWYFDNFVRYFYNSLLRILSNFVVLQLCFCFTGICKSKEKIRTLKLSFMSDKISPFCCQSGCLENTILHPELRTSSSSITLGSRIFKPETPSKSWAQFFG